MARIQVVGTRKQPGRCAYCRDSLDALVHRCEGCSTWLHLDCLEELGRCPTSGCAGEATPSAPHQARLRARAPRRGERRERRARHRQRRRDPSPQTLREWAAEEAVDHHRAPTGWSRAAPYSRLLLSGLFHLALVSAFVFALLYAFQHPHATWEMLRRGKHGSSDANAWMGVLFYGGCGGFFTAISLHWLWRWPTVWDEVGHLLDQTRPLPMRLRVWTEGSGKHKQTWAELRALSSHHSLRFKLSGLLPPGWLRRSRAGTPVLVYGIDDGEPPYLIESGNGQLALVHPD